MPLKSFPFEFFDTPPLPPLASPPIGQKGKKIKVIPILPKWREKCLTIIFGLVDTPAPTPHKMLFGRHEI